jgi:precorrin-6B methylase 2
MAKQRTTFNKLQRERAKKAKAAEKRERRLERAQEAAEAVEAELEEVEELTAPELLDRIAQLHKDFEDGKLEFEEFEEQKLDLFERLTRLPTG